MFMFELTRIEFLLCWLQPDRGPENVKWYVLLVTMLLHFHCMLSGVPRFHAGVDFTFLYMYVCACCEVWYPFKRPSPTYQKINLMKQWSCMTKKGLNYCQMLLMSILSITIDHTRCTGMLQSKNQSKNVRHDFISRRIRYERNLIGCILFVCYTYCLQSSLVFARLMSRPFTECKHSCLSELCCWPNLIFLRKLNKSCNLIKL